MHNITFLKYFCVKTILNCINLYFLIILYNSFIILPQMSPPTRHEKDFSKIFFQRRDITLRGTCGKPQVRVRASLAKWRKHRKKSKRAMPPVHRPLLLMFFVLFFEFSFFFYRAFLKESSAKNFAHCGKSCFALLAVRLPGNSALSCKENL
ncbi:MAG: hypothetical protein LIO50_08060 [Phascolarctobacterium sp.]|uniref:hypothetical protein n=1 Tax=Phascolarctobacterium sp. TaxID=2049039 RepID=UPI0025F150B5|nr:hypothetical protein [Phascolarctobacterium sp.]MCC8159155.1 hypothetical protein [Phascolarctobacterium sp.]